MQVNVQDDGGQSDVQGGAGGDRDDGRDEVSGSGQESVKDEVSGDYQESETSGLQYFIGSLH